MDIKEQEQLHDRQLEVDRNYDRFNFELWARAVKPQMVAALQRRARQSDRVLLDCEE